jgi:septal ring factor EnvC (AmiA/AmiB activator)
METVDIDLTTLSASMHSMKSSFSQIAFTDINETYAVGNDMRLKYVVEKDVRTTSRDWIGLYQVGWRSIQNYKCFEYVPEQAGRDDGGKPAEYTLVFPAAVLPSEDGEFYQFCYVTSKGQVWGLSTPFQFRKSVSASSSLEEFVEIEDENGELLIIKSKTAYLDEQLKKSNEKCSLLCQDIKLLENEKDLLILGKKDMEKKVSSMAEEIGSFKKQIAKLNEHTGKLTSEITNLKGNISQLTDANSALLQEKASLERMLTECQNQLRTLEQMKLSLLNEKDAMLGQLTTLQNEKELYQTHYSTTESSLKAHVERISGLETELATSQQTVATCRSQIEELKDHLNKLTDDNEQLNRDNADKQKAIDVLKQTQEQMQHQLGVLENEEKDLKMELEAAVEVHQKMSLHLENSRSESEMLKYQLDNLKASHSKECNDLEEKIKAISMQLTQTKEEKENLSGQLDVLNEAMAAHSETDSALFALQAAYCDMKERYTKLTKNTGTQQSLLEQSLSKQRSLEAELARCQDSVRDLKSRLLMGQEHYKEKVIECLKLEEDLKKCGGGCQRVDCDNDDDEEGATASAPEPQGCGELPSPLIPQKMYVDPAAESTSQTDTFSETSEDMLGVCPVCKLTFPETTSADYRTAHIDMHFVGEICPMCNEKFQPNDPMFAAHVQSHFAS